MVPFSIISVVVNNSPSYFLDFPHFGILLNVLG